MLKREGCYLNYLDAFVWRKTTFPWSNSKSRMVPALVTPLLPMSMHSGPINMVLLLILFYIKNMLAKL